MKERADINHKEKEEKTYIQIGIILNGKIQFTSFEMVIWLANLPILVDCVVGSFFTVAGTVAVTTLVFSGCGNCGK